MLYQVVQRAPAEGALDKSTKKSYERERERKGETQLYIHYVHNYVYVYKLILHVITWCYTHSHIIGVVPDRRRKQPRGPGSKRSSMER